MKKFLGVLLVGVVLVGFLVWRNYSSPEYSIGQIGEAIENHDIAQFEKYFNLANVLSKAGVSDDVLKKEILAYVEYDKSDLANYIHSQQMSDIMASISLDDCSVKDISIEESGKMAKILLTIHVDKYEEPLKFNLIARSKGDHWQVSEVTNFHTVYAQTMGLEGRNKRYAALLFISRSVLGNSIERVNAILNISKLMIESGEKEKAGVLAREAQSIIGFMEDKIDLDFAQLDIVGVYAKTGNVDEAISLANSNPDDDFGDFEKFDIANILANKGKIGKALEVIASIKNDINKNYGLMGIVGVLAKKGETKKAQLIANDIAIETYRVSAYMDIVKALFKSDKSKANKLIEKSLFVANGTGDASDEVSALLEISKALFKAKEDKKANELISKALQIARNMQNVYKDTEAFLKIAKAHSMRNENDTAKKLIEIAFESIPLIHNKYRKNQRLIDTSLAFAEAGYLERALTVSYSIEDKYHKSTTEQKLAVEFAKDGNTKRALSVAERIEDKSYKYSAIRGIVNEVTKEGEIKKALEIVNSIQSYKYKKEALFSMMSVLAHDGKTKETINILKSLFKEYDKSVVASMAIDALSKIPAKTKDEDAKIAKEIVDTFIYDFVKAYK